MNFEGESTIIIAFLKVDLEFSYRFLKAHHNYSHPTCPALLESENPPTKPMPSLVLIIRTPKRGIRDVGLERLEAVHNMTYFK